MKRICAALLAAVVLCPFCLGVENPEVPESPGVTEVPESSAGPEAPTDSESPEAGEAPAGPESPKVSGNPAVSEGPEVSADPGVSESPEVSAEPESPEASDTPEGSAGPEEETGGPAPAPAVSAASAILMEASTGRVLFEKEAHTPRLIASTTKLMTALVAVESTPDLQSVVEVKREYQAEGSSMYLKAGEELTLEELLYGLLLASGNDAALAIAGGCAGDVETFVGWMNEKAAELGMEDTHFENPNGLDQEGHLSSAYDLALLGRAVLENETLRKIVSTKTATVAGRSLANHNKLLWRYEGCVGLKTGYTDAAGRTLVSGAEREGMTLICVTLKDRDDWDDHAALFDYGFGLCRMQPLCREGKVFRSLEVRGSVLPTVEVVTARAVAYPLGGGEKVRALITLPDMVQAPVEEGAIAGKLTFLLGEKPIGETYLLYAGSCPVNEPKLSLFERIFQSLRGEGEPLAALSMERG